MISDTFIRYIAQGYSSDPVSLIFELMNDIGKGQHLIKIGKKDKENPSIEWEYELLAYHIDFFDWIILKATAQRAMFDEFNDEGIEFSFYSFLKEPCEVPLPKCNTPFFLGVDTSVSRNCIDENADCNGTMAGCRAERNYYYWVEDIQRYAILKMGYFVL